MPETESVMFVAFDIISADNDAVTASEKMQIQLNQLTESYKG